MLIIDSHAHIFPYLGGKSGYSSVNNHLTVCQKGMHKHLSQPVRKVKDNSIVKDETLWDPDDPSINGKYKVDFRVGQFGRFEWTKDNVNYYIQYLPPSLQNMTAPPGLLKAQMDYAGVDQAVLQCGGTYGKLNYYYAMALDEFPDLADTFIPLARIDENKDFREEQIQRLRNCINNLGFRGLWFAPEAQCFEPKYKSFWDEVERLNVPVFWALFPKEDIYLPQIKKLGQWMEKYPNVPCVIPQAFPLSPTDRNDKVDIPAFAETVIKEGNLYLEIAYPIGRGSVEEYPFPISQEAVKKLYHTFGAHKLVWGSDTPMVERYCTYPQSLNYLKEHCEFISKEDMELILGRNLQTIFGLKKS